MKPTLLITVLIALVSVVAMANPHTVDVELRVAPASEPEADTRPDNLLLYRDGQQIEVIDFEKDKKFIRFNFPQGYSSYDLKVFEMNEVSEKEAIMQAYQQDREKGVKAFNALWPNHASSEQNAREFSVHPHGGQALVVHNKNVDGTAEGVMHDYILRFTVGDKTYLSDPSIRNKN